LLHQNMVGAGKTALFSPFLIKPPVHPGCPTLRTLFKC
jgi:hypothetical protein